MNTRIQANGILRKDFTGERKLEGSSVRVRDGGVGRADQGFLLRSATCCVEFMESRLKNIAHSLHLPLRFTRLRITSSSAAATIDEISTKAMQTCAKRSDDDGLILKLGKERRGIPLFRVLPFDFIVARIPLQIKCGVYSLF